jgi:hypothetical protein
MLTGWMLYTMWAVLGLIGLNWLVDIYRALVGKTFSWDTLTEVLGPILYTVLPLLILTRIMDLDPTGWIILIAYYLSGLGVVLKLLLGLKKKLF